MLAWMPSRLQIAAMESSPRKPSRTILIFSSAEYFFLVRRRISRTVLSDVDFDFILTPVIVCVSFWAKSVQLILTAYKHPQRLVTQTSGRIKMNQLLLLQSLIQLVVFFSIFVFLIFCLTYLEYNHK